MERKIVPVFKQNVTAVEWVCFWVTGLWIVGVTGHEFVGSRDMSHGTCYLFDVN